MTSTVLDAALCLLLVSAAVVTVTTATPAGATATDDGHGADAAATTLATSTATVNYSLRTDTAGSARQHRGRGRDRTARGTLAELLVDAALARTTIDGERVTRSRDRLVRRVARAVEAAVGTTRTQVVVDWRPYPGAPVRARLTVGGAPGPVTDTHAARLAVAGRGAGPRRSPPEGEGFEPLARRLAATTTATLLPPDRLATALGADEPADGLVRRRYRRVAGLVGVRPPEEELRPADVGVVNGRVERAVARRFERDLERRFDDPAAARRAARAGEVRIVVRRWDG